MVEILIDGPDFNRWSNFVKSQPFVQGQVSKTKYDILPLAMAYFVLRLITVIASTFILVMLHI